ncbi:oxidoreductase [Xylaria sp. FL1777]|nr:oxidoreductase [Xylaria sp. FL1777]
MAKYNKLAGKHVVVIGGTRGIGRGVVEAALESRARVTLAGQRRRRRRLYQGCPTTVEADLDALLARAAREIGSDVDHVVYTAADSLALGKLQDVTAEGALRAAHMRFLVPVMVGKVAQRHLWGSSGGQGRGRGDKSLVLTTGSIASMPVSGWSVIAFFAAGIKGLTRNLALDLSPVRVNVVEPGIVNTGLWDTSYKSVEEREAGLKKMCARLPVGRPGAVEEVVEAYMYLLRDANATGEVVQTRGGQHLL